MRPNAVSQCLLWFAQKLTSLQQKTTNLLSEARNSSGAPFPVLSDVSINYLLPHETGMQKAPGRCYYCSMQLIEPGQKQELLHDRPDVRNDRLNVAALRDEVAAVCGFIADVF